MDPISVLKKTRDLLPGGPNIKHFGPGRPCEEKQDCEFIHVFMTCVGQGRHEQRRVMLPKDTTLKQAKAAFGREMKQQLISDEDGYRFNQSDLDKSLWNFSNRCCLNLQFEFEDHLQELVEKGSGLKGITSGWISSPSALPAKM